MVEVWLGGNQSLPMCIVYLYILNSILLTVNDIMSLQTSVVLRRRPPCLFWLLMSWILTFTILTYKYCQRKRNFFGNSFLCCSNNFAWPKLWMGSVEVISGRSRIWIRRASLIISPFICRSLRILQGGWLRISLSLWGETLLYFGV